MDKKDNIQLCCEAIINDIQLRRLYAEMGRLYFWSTPTVIKDRNGTQKIVCDLYKPENIENIEKIEQLINCRIQEIQRFYNVEKTDITP